MFWGQFAPYVFILAPYMSYMVDRTTIIIKPETRDILKKMGRKSETYDDIIKELLRRNDGHPL